MMPAGFAPENIGAFVVMVVLMVGLAFIGWFLGRHDTYK